MCHANNPRRTAAIAALVLLSILSACAVENSEDNGSGAGDSSRAIDIKNATSCPVEIVNDWVYAAMQDYYLFYDQLPQVDVSSYNKPEDLIKALRVQPYDTYSYVTDATTYNAFFNEGETFGFGWNFAAGANETLFFSLIEPGSPLAATDIKRGDQLLKINGFDLPSYRALSQPEKVAMLGVAGEIKTIELTVASNNETERVVSVSSATFAMKTVLDTKVIERNGVKVGYLHFYQFVNTSSEELETAFTELAAEGVSELVLDLRFNGGGRIAVANELASRIIGNNHTNDVFTTFAHNDKYQSRNSSLNFTSMTQSLSLNRLFVLQSENTCSASELVVNSLRPFMEVITVGSTSCGKPYATSPNTACGKVANALEIELLNADNAGGYFNGIAADCVVDEDVSQPLGEAAEPLLATALSYIDNGSCTLIASRTRRARHQLTSEFKPAWQGGNSL